MAPSVLYEDVRLLVESERLLVTAAGSSHAIGINTNTNEVAVHPSTGLPPQVSLHKSPLAPP